jgi:hypothetical protein
MRSKTIAIISALVIGPTSLAAAQTRVRHGKWSHATSVSRGRSNDLNHRGIQSPAYGHSSAPLWEWVTDDGGGRFRPCYGGG